MIARDHFNMIKSSSSFHSSISVELQMSFLQGIPWTSLFPLFNAEIKKEKGKKILTQILSAKHKWLQIRMNLMDIGHVDAVIIKEVN